MLGAGTRVRHQVEMQVGNAGGCICLDASTAAEAVAAAAAAVAAEVAQGA